MDAVEGETAGSQMVSFLRPAASFIYFARTFASTEPDSAIPLQGMEIRRFNTGSAHGSAGKIAIGNPFKIPEALQRRSLGKSCNEGFHFVV